MKEITEDDYAMMLKRFWYATRNSEDPSLKRLAESGGASFYINHTLWNYWVALIFIMVLRGGSDSSE